MELQVSAGVHEAEARRSKNRAIILKLLHPVYFLVKSRIPHINNYQDLVNLQVANGGLLAAIDKWVDQESLVPSPICCRWIVNDQPEEHFMSILCAKALNVATISESIQIPSLLQTSRSRL